MDGVEGREMVEQEGRKKKDDVTKKKKMWKTNGVGRKGKRG